jgi:hypothetical protein
MNLFKATANAILEWNDPQTHGRKFKINVYHGLAIADDGGLLGIVEPGVERFSTPPLLPGDHFFTLMTVDELGARSRRLVLHAKVPA